ncbi:MAG: GntR family transcriptional regulator [Prolixibacteraceae bacterium]|nr:GntR family transcriptional regulator [Prolixibacteraceae bacterium]
MKEFKFKPEESSSLTKLQQLIHAVTEAINVGTLKEGDTLPSVNKLSRDSGISRDTIFKAYKALKKRSVISSTPTKGYFVATESYRVFVLLDDFSAFKEQFYNSFRNELPESYTVDLLFHHYNYEIFEQLIQNSLGKYNMYLVMNINNKRVEDVVHKIDPNKLLILDMGKVGEEGISYLTQDFDKVVYRCLEQGLDRIRKYDEFILIFPPSTPHPAETIDAFREFCRDHSIKCSIHKKVTDIDVKKGQAYFVIKDNDLVSIVKNCKQKGFQLGIDMGILSYNDTPMKEIVGSGISVISTDFIEMGRKAADFVARKEKISEQLSTRLILRGSL